VAIVGVLPMNVKEEALYSQLAKGQTEKKGTLPFDLGKAEKDAGKG